MEFRSLLGTDCSTCFRELCPTLRRKANTLVLVFADFFLQSLQFGLKTNTKVLENIPVSFPKNINVMFLLWATIYTINDAAQINHWNDKKSTQIKKSGNNGMDFLVIDIIVTRLASLMLVLVESPCECIGGVTTWQ